MKSCRRDAAEAAAAAGEQPGKAVAGEKRKAAAEPADAEEHLSFGKIEMDSGALPFQGLGQHLGIQRTWHSLLSTGLLGLCMLC